MPNVAEPDTIIIYPEIKGFFEKLANDYLRHRDGLIKLSRIFVGEDFFCINEITDQTEEWFKALPYVTSAGNA